MKSVNENALCKSLFGSYDGVILNDDRINKWSHKGRRIYYIIPVMNRKSNADHKDLLTLEIVGKKNAIVCLLVAKTSRMPLMISLCI